MFKVNIFDKYDRAGQLEDERTLAILNELLIEDEICKKDFNFEYERIK